MIDYGHEHRPRGGNNGFIGDGRFRHNYEVATKAEQRKDYGQAAHYYDEAMKAAKNDKHRTTAKNRKDTCLHKMGVSIRSRWSDQSTASTENKSSPDPVISELRQLMRIGG